jgi:uncharacterized membrane protein YeiH
VHGLSPAIIVISGTLTGISGGMLRDIFCNDIPLVLRREFYAVIALAGSFFYWLLMVLGVHENLVNTLIVLFVFFTRVLAIRYHFEMPKFSYRKNLKKSVKRYKKLSRN